MKIKTSKIIILMSIGLSACMNGPSFMKQSNESSLSDNELSSVILETKDENGVATGAINPDSGLTQVLQASSNSSIAGSSVSFPPGSIAINTDVSISAGDSIASDSTILELGLDNGIASSAPSIAVSSSIALDAGLAFTISLPLPNSAGLYLQNPEENIAVFYKVNKAVAGGSFTGIITAENIGIKNGFAVISTLHFGTFQVAYLKRKLTATVEVASTETPQVVPEAAPKKPVVYNQRPYVHGFQSFTFGSSQTAGGLQGWGHTVSPGRVGSAGTSLTKDYTVRVFKGE